MEPLTADEGARGAAFDALLLDLFEEIGTTDACNSTTSAVDASDNAFVDFQVDLAAFDALMESPQSDLVLDIAVSLDTESSPPVKREGASKRGVEAITRCAPGGNTVSNSAAPVVKKKSAPGGNIARKRHREELRALRESVVVLEKELWNLRANTSKSSPPPHSNSISGGGGRHGLSTLSSDQKAPRRWPPQAQPQRLKVHIPLKPPAPKSSNETVLTNETHAQQITELENIHLSKLVNDHQKVAQQFEKALRKDTPPSTAELLETMPTAERSSGVYLDKPLSAIFLPHTASDTLVFDALERNVEARYHELERVFRAVGLSDCRTNLREVRVDTDHEEGGVLLKFKSSRLIPFSVHEINETALKITRSNMRKGAGTLHERDGMSVAFKKQIQAGDITINVRGVSKRYTENGRIVIVWDGISEWPSKVPGETVTIEEKGWGIIQPLASSYSTKPQKKKKKNQSLLSPLSLLQSYTYMTPGPTKEGEKREAPQPEHIAILSDVVMPLYQKVFASRIQHLENVLVEDSLKRRLVAS